MTIKELDNAGETEPLEPFELKLTISAEDVESTDESFTMDNLTVADNYEPLDVYFKKDDGTIVRRERFKGEHQISRRTMPFLACQIFEKQLVSMSVKSKRTFPICKYLPTSRMICGIYASLDEYQKQNTKTIGFLVYNCADGKQLVFHCWNIFSTIIFVQECLRRFGKSGEQMILIYKEKTGKTGGPTRYRKRFSRMLIESRNLIFRGAPGTGKSYLAKEIAADIVSGGQCKKYADLSEEQKKQVGFVQFHPSYDYSDFVEGLRPALQDGAMGFELRDGTFKEFVDRARENFEASEKNKEDLKKYVFIIDEINRGEISKIFGELFFAIDPGYRGRDGEVSTQYANMHANPEEKFYIPENVYIIGTMNDIDRSVDSFDFAMRRRFRFVELKADEHAEMLDSLGDMAQEAKARMNRLNEAITNQEGLNENYQIGAAYFLKLNTMDFDDLWTDCLRPLLQEYVQGMHDESGILERFEKAYREPSKETQAGGKDADESGQD